MQGPWATDSCDERLTQPLRSRSVNLEPAAFEIPADRLRRRLDPASLPFTSTAEVAPLEGTIGQPRALEALEFGSAIPTAGFNIFVTGAPGSGRLSTVEGHLERVAQRLPAPHDWVYVQNFTSPDRPVAIPLPPGHGARFRDDLDRFVADARRRLAEAIDSDDYQRRRAVVSSEVEQRVQSIQNELESIALAAGFALQLTPAGVVLIPVADGRRLSPDDVQRLSNEQRADLDRRAAEVRPRLDAEVPKLRQVEREGAEHMHTVEREYAISVITPLLEHLRSTYAAEQAVLTHLDALRDDIPGHLAELAGTAQSPELPIPQLTAQHDGGAERYRVNVVVDNGGLEHAPVVVERNPTYYNLMGRVEYRASFGTMVTDFLHIRGGALHRANGGFLVMDADALLRQPFAWDALKRALQTMSVAVENLAEQVTLVPTTTLHPEPVPLAVRVVLIGSPLLYHMLGQTDLDLRAHFKVRADFAPDMTWDDANVLAYAGFIRRTVDRCSLRHFSAGGVARIVEHGSRLRQDQRKLSAQLAEIGDLAAEASFCAEQAAHELVEAGDVDDAIRKKIYRSSLTADRMREYIDRRIIAIDTDGATVGQVNGLSVAEIGDHSFGVPTRITASVSLGRGRVESVEREINVSGPSHSKGVLVLSGYLADRYAQEFPLPVHVRITFEQSYDEVDGDSASSTELYAILSALSGVPIRQGIAVTGSVDQHGDVQAVGGVVEKVEGFFAVCTARGLSGTQGVMIPAANAESLMVSDEVVQACRDGRFHVWAVRTIDEGIELLTGEAAGERAADGSYPEGSIHRRIIDRLRDGADRMREFSGGTRSG